MGATGNAVMLKSKTINFNALFLAVIAVAGAVGFEMQPELVAALQTRLNVALRFVTDLPLGEK